MKKIILIFLITVIFLFGCTAEKISPGQDAKEQQNKETPPLEKKSNSDSIGQNINDSKNENLNAPITDSGKNNTGINIEVKTTKQVEKTEEKTVNGKKLKERLVEATDRLHTSGSGQQIRNDFPDITLLYTDKADGTGFPSTILPFRYYYSEEADKTFNICNIDFTVFICNGKLDRVINREDVDSGRCEVTPIYKSDPRIGGSGASNYGYGR